MQVTFYYLLSKFWRDCAAGKPLAYAEAWRRKDADIARSDPEFAADISMPAWMHIGDREQRRLLREALAAPDRQETAGNVRTERKTG